VILPKLGNGYIVPDPEVGRGLALENPDAFFLSQSGECFHNVTVTGGKQRSEGPLSMKRELRDVLRQMANWNGPWRAETGVAALGREITEMVAAARAPRRRTRESERQAMTSGTPCANSKRDDAGARAARPRMSANCNARGEERRSGDLHHRAAQRNCFSTKRSSACWKRRCSRAEQPGIAASASRRSRGSHFASEVRANVATLEERRRGAMLTVQRIERCCRKCRTGGQIEGAARIRHRRETAAANRRTFVWRTVVEWTAERDVAQQRDRQLQDELQSIRVRIVEMEERLKSRVALDAARDRRGELSGRAQARVQSDLQHMSETCVQELWPATRTNWSDDSLPRSPAKNSRPEDQRLSRNAHAPGLHGPGEHDGAGGVQGDGAAPRISSRRSARTCWNPSRTPRPPFKEIDVISRQKFEEAFNIINENFARTLSASSSAAARASCAHRRGKLAESGIDVVASPPGKKLQNVLLLSGGEKALTALALLVGIFQYQPSPFCILDEVDAPLDEANIGRFTELVREMSARPSSSSSRTARKR
jgi:chromosome segregation protein